MISTQLTESHEGHIPEFRKGINTIMLYQLGATRPGVWAIKHLVSPLQRWIYQKSGGKHMASVGSSRGVLLLTAKGRRTGKDRTTPLFYLRDGEAIVICNVIPEFERTNPWVLNLLSHPVARLQIGQKTADYKARQAAKDEINRLWPRLVELWPAYKDHYERGGRRSIFILEHAELF